MADACERGNEPSGSAKCGEFLCFTIVVPRNIGFSLSECKACGITFYCSIEMIV